MTKWCLAAVWAFVSLLAIAQAQSYTQTFKLRRNLRRLIEQSLDNSTAKLNSSVVDRYVQTLHELSDLKFRRRYEVFKDPKEAASQRPSNEVLKRFTDCIKGGVSMFASLVCLFMGNPRLIVITIHDLLLCGAIFLR